MQEQQVEYNTGFKLQHGEQKVLEMMVLVQEDYEEMCSNELQPSSHRPIGWTLHKYLCVQVWKCSLMVMVTDKYLYSLMSGTVETKSTILVAISLVSYSSECLTCLCHIFHTQNLSHKCHMVFSHDPHLYHISHLNIMHKIKEQYKPKPSFPLSSFFFASNFICIYEQFLANTALLFCT